MRKLTTDYFTIYMYITTRTTLQRVKRWTYTNVYPRHTALSENKRHHVNLVCDYEVQRVPKKLTNLRVWFSFSEIFVDDVESAGKAVRCRRASAFEAFVVAFVALAGIVGIIGGRGTRCHADTILLEVAAFPAPFGTRAITRKAFTVATFASTLKNE